jgi:hypothetical protein
MLLESTGMPDFTEEERREMQGMEEEEIREEFGDRWAEAEVSMAEQMEAFATLVWLGMLHVDPNADRGHVLATLDPATVDNDVPVDTMLDRVWPQLSQMDVEAGKE